MKEMCLPSERHWNGFFCIHGALPIGNHLKLCLSLNSPIHPGFVPQDTKPVGGWFVATTSRGFLVLFSSDSPWVWGSPWLWGCSLLECYLDTGFPTRFSSVVDAWPYLLHLCSVSPFYPSERHWTYCPVKSAYLFSNIPVISGLRLSPKWWPCNSSSYLFCFQVYIKHTHTQAILKDPSMKW